VVHAANKHDGKAAFEVIEPLKYRFERMKKIYADGGCQGELAENVKKNLVWIWKLHCTAINQQNSSLCQSDWLLEELLHAYIISDVWLKTWIYPFKSGFCTRIKCF
jgi:hypothetical protein